MHTDLLFIVAEVGAAFTGFATLVAVISHLSGRPPVQVRLHFRLLQNELISSLFARNGPPRRAQKFPEESSFLPLEQGSVHPPGGLSACARGRAG